MKRFIALVLSLVMALSLCVPAWGAGEVTTEAALAAALEKGGTVTLGADIISENGFTVTKDTILDLNKHTLTVTGEKAYAITSDTSDDTYGNENLTIKNGKLVAKSTNGVADGTGTSTGASSSVLFASYGKLTMENVKIEGSVRGGHHAIQMHFGTAELNNVDITSFYGTGITCGNGGSAVLNDCDITVTGMYSAPYNSTCFSVQSKGSLTINSGNYKLINNNTYSTGDTHGGWVAIVMNSGGTITINDGTFTNVPTEGFNPQYERAIIEAENLDPAVATVNLYGGTFIPQEDNVVSGYGDVNYPVINGELIDNGDGTWSAKKVPNVATADGVPYKTLQAAVNAGGNVVLLSEVELSDLLKVTSAVTLDLAGHSLSKASGSSVVYVNGENASLTIKDSSNPSVGKVVGIAGQQAVYVSAGKFTLESGSIIAEQDAVFVTGAGTVNVNGGLIEAGHFGVFSGGNGAKANTIVCDGATIESDVASVYHNGSAFGANVTIKNNSKVVGDVLLSGSADWATTSKMNKLTISDSTIEGKTAVEVKHGNVTVTNSTLKATGEVAERNYNNGSCTEGYALALTNNGMSASDSEASTGTVTINSGNFTGVIGIKAADSTKMVSNTEGAKIVISGGYFTTNVSDYVVADKVVVTSDKEGYPYTVGVKVEDTAEVEVAEPEVKVEIDATGKTEAEVEAATEAAEEIAEKLQETNAVEICDDALTAVATEVANETSSEAKNAHVEELNDVLVNDVTADKVEIAVQTYFDIKVADVEVTTQGSDTTVTEVTLNITPMYQLVATTTDVLNDPNQKIDTDNTDGTAANAVKIGEPVAMKLDKPVEITVTLPDAFKGQLVYVKHQAEKGVAIYKATADANSGKLTFTTKSGFSPFTFSIDQIDVGASVTGGDDYADLQSALNYAGKNAEITVKVKDQSAIVSGEFSFTLKYEGEAKKENTTISAAPGYSVSGPDANGVYTVTKKTSGGWYPYPSTTPDSELVKSPDTFDAGIALYVGVSVMGAIGTVALSKKRED